MSAKFRFRLDTVLDHRERIEREKAGVHARMLADQRVAERQHADLIGRRDSTRAMLVREHGRLDATTLQASYVHLDYLDRALVASQQRVNASIVATERARMVLVDAAKDRQVLETLKTRQREAFDAEATLAEQRELDDLNARLFERARSFEGNAP